MHCWVRPHLSYFFLRQMKTHRKLLLKSQKWSSGWLSNHQTKCLSIHLMSDPPSACWKDVKANSIHHGKLSHMNNSCSDQHFLMVFLLHAVKRTWRASSGSVAGAGHSFNQRVKKETGYLWQSSYEPAWSLVFSRLSFVVSRVPPAYL